MPGRETSLQRLADVWNGLTSVDDLDALVTPGYVGHLGFRSRDLARLKEDIAAYRARTGGVRFEVLHRFGEGEYVATRVVAHAIDPITGAPLSACGLNISRWRDGLLAEEWAVWEPLTANTDPAAG